MNDNPAPVAGSGSPQTQTPPSGGVSVQFYHLTTSPLERALPKLLEKCFSGGFKTLVVAPTQQIDRLDQLLWTYDPNGFLPHGVSDPERQPIFISPDSFSSASGEKNDSFNLLVVTDGSTPPQPESFQRILDIFDGRDEDAVGKARGRWTLYKNAGHAVSYMKQTETGSWQQAA